MRNWLLLFRMVCTRVWNRNLYLDCSLKIKLEICNDSGGISRQWHNQPGYDVRRIWRSWWPKIQAAELSAIVVTPVWKKVDEVDKATESTFDMIAVSIQSRILSSWREHPRYWFTQYDVIVDPLKTSDDEQKYPYVMCVFRPSYNQQIGNILLRLTINRKYTALKTWVVTDSSIHVRRIWRPTVLKAS